VWLSMVADRRYTVISLFAGCGGSSLGYKWAEFKELLAIDFEKNAVETFKLNFDAPVWERDIKTVTADEIMEFCKISVGELDILDGSPPCQGFSTAGKRKVSDSRNDLFLEFIRLVKGLQPKVFVMENVSGMIKGKMKGRFNEIIGTLKTLGYVVRCKLMNAMYYEVPQSRERVIFIGVRNDLNINPVYPEASKKIITFREATKEIGNYSDRDFPEVLKKIGILQPKNLWSTEVKAFKLIKGNVAGSISTKWAINDKPIGAMLKSEISIVGIVHPDRGRYLNIDELKVCQSFPVDFKLIDRKTGIERLGNSVPPKMMYHIAKTIKEEILDKLKVEV